MTWLTWKWGTLLKHFPADPQDARTLLNGSKIVTGCLRTKSVERCYSFRPSSHPTAIVFSLTNFSNSPSSVAQGRRANESSSRHFAEIFAEVDRCPGLCSSYGWVVLWYRDGETAASGGNCRSIESWGMALKPPWDRYQIYSWHTSVKCHERRSR